LAKSRRRVEVFKVKVVAFEQAAIKVHREREFEKLKRTIEHVFAPDRVEKYLKQLSSAGIRIRDFDSVLATGVFERIDRTLAESGESAKDLYAALTLTDQAQMKELYLLKVEEVAAELRAKFHKLYQYY
jgi:hypothetical protein